MKPRKLQMNGTQTKNLAIRTTPLLGITAAGTYLWISRHYHLPTPICPLYAQTGIYCPGCGTSRALLALADGQLPQAARYNILTITLIAITLAWIVKPQKINNLLSKKHTLWIALTILTIWTVARNLTSALSPDWNQTT